MKQILESTFWTDLFKTGQNSKLVVVWQYPDNMILRSQLNKQLWILTCPIIGHHISGKL
jgi:FPC/CPF motif-containing protein YcgG